MEENQELNKEGLGNQGNGDSPSGPEGGDSLVRVTGMYKDWFLDYASYVILERAVPHIDD